MNYKQIFDIKLYKFLLVGVINTIVGSGTMFILYNFAGLNYWFSTVCNYIVGGICSYFLNKYFTFNNKSKSIKQILLFILNLILCYCIAYIAAKKIIYYMLENKDILLKDNISMLVGMFLYTVLNYFAQRFIIFKVNSENKNP